MPVFVAAYGRPRLLLQLPGGQLQLHEINAKALIVESLLENLPPGLIIASELPFDEGLARCDLALIGNAQLSAIEIKTSLDDLRKLDSQLPRYRERFLDVTIYVGDRHIEKAAGLLPRRVGLGLIESDSVLIIRKPARKTILRKSIASEWLSAQDCRRILNSIALGRNADVVELRRLIERNFTAHQLTAFAIDSLRRRAEKKWLRFVNFLGKSVTAEDVSNMSGGELVYK